MHAERLKRFLPSFRSIRGTEAPSQPPTDATSAEDSASEASDSTEDPNKPKRKLPAFLSRRLGNNNAASQPTTDSGGVAADNFESVNAEQLGFGSEGAASSESGAKKSKLPAFLSRRLQTGAASVLSCTRGT